jgi:pSer/pThr/pTyr-binding forkhead associated (FHA) protein
MSGKMSGWILQSNDDPPIILRLPTGVTRTVGRTARADFIVDAALISRLHCRLTADQSNQLVVDDLGSTNGTLVNGRRVERQVLRTGDVLTVGRVTFTVTDQTAPMPTNRSIVRHV